MAYGRDGGAETGGEVVLTPAGRGVVVERDGHPQSHVDLADPRMLGFEYIQHFACVLDALPDGPLRVTHVGGGGLSLPRYVSVTRPGSPQIVLEPDDELTQLVRRELPLPRGHRIRVRAVDGRSGTGALGDASADVIVVDAYAEGRMPAELGTVEYFEECARVLGPSGVLLVNVADESGQRYARRVISGLVTCGLPGFALIGTHDVLKGRRFGNVVLVGWRGALNLAAVRRQLARSPFPSGLRTAAELRPLLRGVRPFTDNDSARSPIPPDPGQWRIR